MNGTYQVQFDLPQCSEDGSWFVDYIELRDKNNNARYLAPANLTAQQIAASTIQVRGWPRGWQQQPFAVAANTKANVAIQLANLTQNFDGSEKKASFTISPENLAQNVTLTYNGVTTIPTEVGNYTVVAFLNHPNYQGRSTAQMSITNLAQKPSITSVLSGNGTVGTAFSYQIAASNSPSSYGASGLPSGLSINTSSGLISGTPTAAGNFTVNMSASNAGGTGTATLAIRVLPVRPSITSVLSGNGTVGTAFSYQIAASNSPSSYGASGLPSGLSINTSSGLISGTPTAAGNFTVNMSASNAGGTGTATLAIRVLPVRPSITSVLSGNGTVGTAFSYQIAASNSPSSYGASGLPSGLSINTSSGLISGTPTAAGNFTVNMSASNAGGTGTATLAIRVLPVRPSITSVLSGNGTVGTAFSYQIAASNSPSSYGASGLPSGLSINTSSGLISGTPTAAGNFTVNMSASNAGGTGTATLAIRVLPVRPSITSVLSGNGTVGTAFSYQIAASNSPSSYGASGLPSGLSINTSSGLISGTPTAAGNFTVNMSASNAGGTGTATLAIRVLPVRPSITSVLSGNGTVGTAFSYQIAASNSPSSYGASGLPSGLSINTSSGLISGTPTAAGNFTVNMSASNAGGTGTATLAIRVSLR
jgi:PKD repeat protein